MPRTLIGGGLAAAFLLSACAAPRPPILLKVSSSGKVPARIEIHPKTGSVDPLECRAPCNFKLTQEVEADLTMTADGYFPAVLPISHSIFWTGRESMVLVVPLVRRGE